jgi:GNAT superfamily N-acetyltransferase
VKTFAVEHAADYASLRFSYGLFAEWQPGDDPGAFWDAGFLPWSGDPAEPRHLFYMARSLRVPLAALRHDKKHRYQMRRPPLDRLQLEISPPGGPCASLLPVATLQAWMRARFGDRSLAPERLAYILAKPFLNTLLTARLDGEPVAQALVCRGGDAAHYWYAFYDYPRHAGRSLGKWLLTAFLRWAGAEGLRHAYLGTVYDAAAAYKFQGLAAAEFWDGARWNPDIEHLRRLL